VREGNRRAGARGLGRRLDVERIEWYLGLLPFLFKESSSAPPLLIYYRLFFLVSLPLLSFSDHCNRRTK